MGENIVSRFSDYKSMAPLDIGSLNFCVVVPKFHIIGHGASCQANFNLAYMDGVGMTHRESVETIWSHSTSLATWSRENGPAAHHLVLDNHWTGWNWRKLVGLCKSLWVYVIYRSANTYLGIHLKRVLERAIKWAKTQRKEADLMTVAWARFVPSWRKMLLDYKKDPKKPNPFEEPDPGRSAHTRGLPS